MNSWKPACLCLRNAGLSIFLGIVLFCWSQPCHGFSLPALGAGLLYAGQSLLQVSTWIPTFFLLTLPPFPWFAFHCSSQKREQNETLFLPSHFQSLSILSPRQLCTSPTCVAMTTSYVDPLPSVPLICSKQGEVGLHICSILWSVQLSEAQTLSCSFLS